MMFLDRRGMWGRCDGCRDRAGPGSIWFGVRGDAGVGGARVGGSFPILQVVFCNGMLEGTFQ